MRDKTTIERIERKFLRLEFDLNERMRRIWTASEAMELGHGGIAAVARATGVAYGRIRAGVAELKAEKKGKGVARVAGGSRRAGGGRKSSKQKDPRLLPALLDLAEPGARGGPQSPLRWTIKSTRVLARELTKQQHPVSHTTVVGLLEKADFMVPPSRAD